MRCLSRCSRQQWLLQSLPSPAIIRDKRSRVPSANIPRVHYWPTQKSCVVFFFPFHLAFQRLLTCLGEIRHKLDSREDDFLFLSNYFQNQDFWKLFKVNPEVLIYKAYNLMSKCNFAKQSSQLRFSS